MNGAFSLAHTFFVKNTFARLAVFALVLGGIIAYSNLIKETTPDLEIGVGIVFTEWAGGDPQSIEQEITNKIEKKLKSIKGLKRLQSGSYAGFSLIVAEFRPDVKQVDAMTRLRAKVAAAEGELPRAAKKPTIVEASINDTPIYSIRLSGDIDLAVVAGVAEDLKRELERTSGVNKVSVSGERDEVIQIRLLGARLAAYGISPNTLRQVLDQASLDLPLGDFDGEEIGAGFRFLGRFRDVEDIRNLPVGNAQSGRTILLSELAEIKRGPEQEHSRTFFATSGGEFHQAIDITLTKRPGADVIKTIKAIERVVARQQATARWPTGLQTTVVADESIYINTDLRNIFNNGWQAMLAVFTILLISLTWREALVAGLAIPITFAGALIIVFALGYSLNQIVIIGMVLALGLLVDDFILMMEGMHENIYVRGMHFDEATIATIKTYALPSLTGSLTTILAMAPLMGIAGIEGKFIRQMPVTAIACLVMSYLVSIFIAVPLSRFVLEKHKAKKTRMDNFTEVYSEKLADLLRRRFLSSRRNAWVAVGVATSIFVLGYALFSTLPTELSPKGDGRSMGITIELSPDASLATSQRCADAVGEQLVNKAYIQNVTKHVGEKSPFTLVSTTDQLSPTSGNYLVGFSTTFILKKDRKLPLYKYVPEIRQDVEAAMLACPGGQAFFSPQLGGASAEDPIQIEIIGEDMTILRQLAQSVAAELRTILGTSDVRDNYGVPKMDLRAYPNREALNFYGLTAADVSEQIRYMMNSDEVNKFVRGGVQEDLPIRMGYAWPSRDGALGGPTTMSELYLLNIITQSGRGVPLPSVVDWRLEESALSILHKNGERALMVMAKTDGRTAGEILADLKPRLDNLKQHWPSGYRVKIAGEAEASEEAFGSAGKMLVLALFLVFALLALQFDSFKQPFVIMSAIPLALTGTFFGFFVMQLPFSFMAMVGIIALIGIVVNDTIIMINTMNSYIKKGKSVVEAAAHGAADRLRPIVTTSVTTIVGLIPLAISQEMWLPLSTTVISGLLFATFLALLIVPCLFLLLTPDNIEQESEENPMSSKLNADK
jgi:multidrug efflux pump subunit AcrB